MKGQVQVVRRGGVASLLFLILGLSVCYGQVLFLGSMFQEKEVEKGQTCFIEFSVVNTKESDIEINLLKKDFLFTDEGKAKFLEPGTVERSNSDWILIKHERLLLGGKKRVDIKIPVVIPKEQGLRGSYYSLLIVRFRSPVKVVEKRGKLNIALQYGVQVVTTISGGEKNIRYSRVEVVGDEKDKLLVEVENSGEIYERFDLKCEIEQVESKAFRVFPECKRQLTLGLEGLEDGEYSTRLILDNGEDLMIPKRIEFRKGKVRPMPPLREVGEDIKKKARKRFLRFWLTASVGSMRKGLNLSGSFAERYWRVGSGYRMFWAMDELYETYFSSVGLNFGKLQINGYLYRFENQTMVNTGMSLRLKKTDLRIGMWRSNIMSWNVAVNHTLPWNHRISAFAYLTKARQSYLVSYSIPVVIYF